MKPKMEEKPEPAPLVKAKQLKTTSSKPPLTKPSEEWKTVQNPHFDQNKKKEVPLENKESEINKNSGAIDPSEPPPMILEKVGQAGAPKVAETK